MGYLENVQRYHVQPLRLIINRIIMSLPKSSLGTLWSLIFSISTCSPPSACMVPWVVANIATYLGGGAKIWLRISSWVHSLEPRLLKLHLLYPLRTSTVGILLFWVEQLFNFLKNCGMRTQLLMDCCDTSLQFKCWVCWSSGLSSGQQGVGPGTPAPAPPMAPSFTDPFETRLFLCQIFILGTKLVFIIF